MKSGRGIWVARREIKASRYICKQGYFVSAILNVPSPLIEEIQTTENLPLFLKARA